MGKKKHSSKKMELIIGGRACTQTAPDLDTVNNEITEQDYARFRAVVSTDLDDVQRERVTTPASVQHMQKSVLAVHWHPEFVPMDLIRRRIDATFPNKEEELIIPTQHNVLMEWDGYAGVEVDCYSSGFNQKVQLLIHAPAQNVAEAHTFRAMLEHTRKYRASQLFDFMHTITAPLEDRISRAAAETGAEADLVQFVFIQVSKIESMLEELWSEVPTDSVKNKVLRNWFDMLREDYGDPFIDRVQTYLKAVKAIVKENFSLEYFYRTSEVIEEARLLGAGIVIPHPEQFWPILLAEYDVDGWEVWNPQSRKYTDFLVTALDEKNRCRAGGREPLLVFMGDDTHFGEKVKDPAHQKAEKAAREVGVQVWEDMNLSKRLIVANMSRRRVMREYRDRLGS